MKLPRGMFAKPKVVMVVSVVLAAIVLYYLLVELTIVQVFAAVAFAYLMVLLSFAAYSHLFGGLATKMLKEGSILKKSWLLIVIWVALSIWVLYTIFF